MISFPPRTYMRKNFMILTFFLFLSLVNFWGSLHNPFILDDKEHYLNFKKLNNAFLVYDLIPNQSFSANPGMEKYQINWGYYRPFMHVIFRIQAQVFKDNPVQYHILCIVFFAWACFSIFQLLSLITKNELAAFLGACLYLLHPFQGLCVNYKTAVTLSIQIILLNIAFITVVNLKKMVGVRDILKYAGAVGCFILAVLIHESAFIFPVILLYYWFILDDKSTRHLRYQWVGFVLVSLVYVWVRFHYEYIFMNSLSHYQLTLKEFLAAYVREVDWVIRKLIYPKDIFLQSSTWVSKSVANQWILVFYVYIVGAISLLLISYKKNKVLFFLFGIFISGFLLSMLPSRNYLGDGIIYFEPHWIFYTNIGLFGLLGYFFSFLLNKYRKFGLLLWVFCVVYLFYFSFVQNRLYHFSESLFKRWSDDSPSLDLPQVSVCLSKVNQGRLEEAIQCYTPLTQRVSSAAAYNDLALIYYLKNDYKKAKENIQKAMDRGMVGSSLKILSLISIKEGDDKQVIRYLDEAILNDKFGLELYLLKIDIYIHEKKWDEAIKVINQVSSIYPLNEDIILARMKIYFQNKDSQAVKQLLSKHIVHMQRLDLLVELSILLLKNKEDVLAEMVYQKALAVDTIRTRILMKSVTDSRTFNTEK